MKIDVDLAAMGAVIQTAPTEMVIANEEVNSFAKKQLPLSERISRLADKALEDVEDQLKYIEAADGSKKSKISENTRQRYNLELINMHPDNQKKLQTTMIVTVDAADLKNAAGAAKDMDRRKAIDTEYRRVE